LNSPPKSNTFNAWLAICLGLLGTRQFRIVGAAAGAFLLGMIGAFVLHGSAHGSGHPARERAKAIHVAVRTPLPLSAARTIPPAEPIHEARPFPTRRASPTPMPTDIPATAPSDPNSGAADALTAAAAATANATEPSSAPPTSNVGIGVPSNVESHVATLGASPGIGSGEKSAQGSDSQKSGDAGAGLTDAASSDLANPSKNCSLPDQPARVVSEATPVPTSTAATGAPVTVDVYLTATGSVIKLNVSQSSGSRNLDTEATDIAKRSTYAPAVRSCTKVPSSLQLQLRL
jgi:TonB family protein